ncbi:hypothetical protein DPMN_027468 [Dreissena polymorpha]|uniref:Solute carrier organic anion transporter family member n=1 Tax=Dreissena polymorpha TaxID=45954 RepID=A0A9D4RFI7_DREPO|nr:hypothetical protein DPMN_027468 [Dreissena polymorpha]
MCGFHRCRPNWLQSCASIKWFTACYGVTSLLTSSLSMYMVSQITTIERQFGFSSTRSGQLMACNDIGFSAFVLIASYSANKVNIPRFLCLSTILYGISGILCSVPHFLHPPQPLGADVNRTDTQLRRSLNETRNFSAHVQTQSDGTGNSNSGTVALALIAIGMVLQGVGKAPRSPMAGKYLDDNTKPRETGFYMGIIQTLAIFGPAIAYGLGGLFSQVYVTLEPVEIHPRDPRWIGAWWLGFLVFGVAAIVFAVPLALFPSSFCATPKVAANRAPREQCCRRTLKDVIGIFTSSYRTLRIREYSLLLVANILNVIGYSAFMSFAPKYLEVQFNMPPWTSNVILGAFGIPAVCIGTFGGGLLTRKLKLTPSRCSLVMFLPQIPCLILTFVTMLLYCDQPRIHNWAQQRSNFLPAPCGGDRICSNNFLPVCAGNGVNYFSPCHAGCSEGTHFKFTNCTCVETGEVSPGLCKFDNCDKLWWVVAVNFVGTVLGASVMMPSFIFNLRQGSVFVLIEDAPL